MISDSEGVTEGKPTKTGGEIKLAQKEGKWGESGIKT